MDIQLLQVELVPVTEEKEHETFLPLGYQGVYDISIIFGTAANSKYTPSDVLCETDGCEYSVDDWRLMYCVRNQWIY